MADIFISYAHSTASHAQRIAEALRSLGYGVWRDDELPAHRSYAEVIEERLKAAKAVVVIWSAEAVRSEWVQSEADRARNDRKLVQLTVDATPLPMPFDRIQCADLNGWTGDPNAPGWGKVVASIADLIGGDSAKPSANSDDAVSIAVLPFVNMSSDPEQEYFSDGLAEELLDRLAKLEGLRVTARTSSFVFKGRNEDVRTIGQRLGVANVLEGSVRKAGQRLRITAQLIKCQDGFHLWSETYNRELDDVFAIQDDVADAVVKALGVTLGVGEKAPAATTNLEAYDKYLRARAKLNNRKGTADYIQAAEMLREVLAIDPDFAPARGALIATYALMMIFLPESSAQTLKEMQDTVRETLARSPDHWASHMARGVLAMQNHDWLEADEALERARALGPSTESAIGVFSGAFLAGMGRVSESVQVLEAARSADPLGSAVSTALQQNLDLAGRFNDAQAEYERTKDLPGHNEIPDHQALIRLWGSGDMEAIKAQARRFFAHQDVAMPVLNEVYEVFDQPQAALTLLRDAFEDPAYKDGTRSFILGFYAAHFGDNALALAAMRHGLLDMIIFGVFPLWYPVMSEARKTVEFKQLVRDLGLYDYWRATGKWGDFARPLDSDDFQIIR